MKGLRELAFMDFEARPIYADWLEEQGDDRARFWRDAAKKRWFPWDGLKVNTYRYMWTHREWAYSRILAYSHPWYLHYTKKTVVMCVVPNAVWGAMKDGYSKHPIVWIKHKTLEDSFETLERAWIETHPKTH